jgi:hypothetical protein
MTLPHLTAPLLNAAGLVLGMLGVLILFFWGPPQPNFEEGVSLTLMPDDVVDGRKISDLDRTTRRLRRRHAIMVSDRARSGVSGFWRSAMGLVPSARLTLTRIRHALATRLA